MSNYNERNRNAADVAPVRHGHWQRNGDTYFEFEVLRCSECGEEWVFEALDEAIFEKYRFCPNCGAKMDGGADNG